MKTPEYRIPLGAGRVCSICGAEVHDEPKHTSFHAALARLLGLEADE